MAISIKICAHGCTVPRARGVKTSKKYMLPRVMVLNTSGELVVVVMVVVFIE